MKTTLMIATVLAAGASAVYAQDPPAAQQVPTAPAAATAPTPGPTMPVPPSPERLNEVRLLENILVNAVNQGATNLARQMQLIDPGSVIPGSVIISPAHARGIALEGYGVLFDVDVPLMNMSVVWTRRQMAVMNLRDQIAEARRLRDRATSPPDQQQLDARIQMLSNQLYMMAPSQTGSSTQSADQAAAMKVAESPPTQPAPGMAVAATAPDVAPVDPIYTRSTDEMYTDAVKKALMDAMLNHSSGLNLGDDEWLTVAARDNNGPTIPGAVEDRSGIILRIRGNDLAAFRANRLNRDEVLKKVEIREWR